LSETVRYRFAKPEEVSEAAHLVAHSFPGPQRTPGWWFEQLRDPSYGGGAETLLIGEEAGRLVAACQVHPLRQWVAGERIPMAGVGTVAISPTHRKRRLGAELVTAALREARQRGDLASALYPFRVSFYQKLGYGSAGEALQYLVPPETLPDSPERMRMETLGGEAERAEALQLYAGWASAENGQLDRPERVWAGLCTEADRALFGYRGASGELEGYALVRYRTDLPLEERYLEVEELIWTSPAARHGLYGWLSSLGDQWQQILMRSLPSHRLGDWLREPRLPRGAAPGWGLWAGAASLMMGPMFRLLDVEKAWSRRRVRTAHPLSVAFEVHDGQIAENDGAWLLQMEDEGVRAERNASGAADIALKLDISTLSRLYIGSLSATAAVNAGLAECDRPDSLSLLDAALLISEPWTFDRF
jgi:predicted acetyltransferase